MKIEQFKQQEVMKNTKTIKQLLKWKKRKRKIKNDKKM